MSYLGKTDSSGETDCSCYFTAPLREKEGQAVILQLLF